MSRDTRIATMMSMLVVVVMILLAGCSSSGDSTVYQDVNKTEVIEVQEQQVDVNVSVDEVSVQEQVINITVNKAELDANKTVLDTKGVDAYKWDIDEDGGTIEVVSVFKWQETDTLDFVVQQWKKVGSQYESYGIIVPTVSKVGNLVMMEGLVYIPGNDANTTAKWKIDILYFGDDVNTIGSFTIEQESKDK